MATLLDFKVGNKVRFVKEFDRQDSYEQPTYLPPLPAGTIGEVVSIKGDYLVVSVVNPLTGEKTLVLVWDVNSPDGAPTERIDCLEVIKTATIKCLTCGRENKSYAKFCVGCGRPLQGITTADPSLKAEPKHCPNCGSKLKPKYKYCTKCGTAIL